MTKSEAQTRSDLIDQQLAQSGWNVKDPTQVVEEFNILTALPEGVAQPRTLYEGHQFSDYVLLGKNRKPLAVIEAKKSSRDAALGREQAKQYCYNIQKQLGGELPFCFYTNGCVESIGRAALTDRIVAFNQQINAIQPTSNVNPLYLYGMFKLSRAYIQSHATKGMKKILTKGDFEKITMIKPPLDIQNQFANIVEKIEGIKSRYQQSLTELETLYAALTQQAFKGELDLSCVPLPMQVTAAKDNHERHEMEQA